MKKIIILLVLVLTFGFIGCGGGAGGGGGDDDPIIPPVTETGYMEIEILNIPAGHDFTEIYFFSGGYDLTVLYPGKYFNISNWTKNGNIYRYNITETEFNSVTPPDFGYYNNNFSLVISGSDNGFGFPYSYPTNILKLEYKGRVTANF